MTSTPSISVDVTSMDKHNAPKVLDRLCSAFSHMGESPPCLSIDLSRVLYMDTAGARCLLEFWAHVAMMSETRLELINVAVAIQPTLDRCKLSHIFPVVKP